MDPAIYAISGLDSVITPALAIYPDIVDSNIDVTLAMADGDPDRWRPHIKTAKLGFTMRRLVERGVVNFKCSTSLELLTACRSGVCDAVVAYPMVGANAARVREIAAEFPGVRVSILAENEAQAAAWRGSRVGVFIDVNPGMDRTGISQTRSSEIVSIARGLGASFRGLHYYDGQIHTVDPVAREREAFAGYDRLMQLAAALMDMGCPIGEVITSGTPAMPCGLKYMGFRVGAFVHRVSPGTVVYNDMQSLELFPGAGYRPAALVLARVVSHPTPDRFTCDAGHKAVSADAGSPTCVVIGRPELIPLKPSEEHLPVQVPAGAARPAIGEIVYLMPRHVCPTVNNFDDALIIRNGRIQGVEPVSARGHESPLVGAAAR
ncbi:MAG: D-TA family PLP-dependent enzyme [Acidobacteria bacterium]|nr:D-TA family PLP-dependent enzyme [Acidobacteriota bacterium]